MGRPQEGYNARSAARLWAVQALYQMDIAKTDLQIIIDEFNMHRLDIPLEDLDVPEADKAYFEKLLRGVFDHQREIDVKINDALLNDWRLSNLDSTLRALLRAGGYEILFESDVPPKVVIAEYTAMAHAYFEGAEAGMANALLDRLAREHNQEHNQETPEPA